MQDRWLIFDGTEIRHMTDQEEMRLADAVRASEIPVLTPEQADEYVCACGNRPDTSGFDNVLADGTVVEPEPGSGWVDLYACRDCSRQVRIPYEKGTPDAGAR